MMCRSFNKTSFAVAVSIIASIIFGYCYGIVVTSGWIYSFAFALSGAPQMIRSIKDGHSNGVADGTMILWMVGEVAGLIYGVGLWQHPIIFNCLLNTICVGIICWYRIFPRKEGKML